MHDASAPFLRAYCAISYARYRLRKDPQLALIPGSSEPNRVDAALFLLRHFLLKRGEDPVSAVIDAHPIELTRAVIDRVFVVACECTIVFGCRLRH